MQQIPGIKPRDVEFFMDVTYRAALMSYAERKKVGALLVRDGHILSTGWNGTPRGANNKCEDDDGNTKPSVIHAESNAIAKLAASTESARDATLFVTMSPCFECAKYIIQSGISQIVYHEDYRITNSLDMLRDSNIGVYKLDGYFPPSFNR